MAHKVISQQMFFIYPSANITSLNQTPTSIGAQPFTIGSSGNITSPTWQPAPSPFIDWILPKEGLLTRDSTVHFVPVKDFIDYVNAPPLTRNQKTEALKIASDSKTNSSFSTLNETTDEKFGDYLSSQHGQITIMWAYPYNGDVYLSMRVGLPTSNVYSLAYATVNVENGSVISEGFGDLHNYW